jgi:hypothetical protein
MLDLKRKATDGSKTLRVQRLSATTGVNELKRTKNAFFVVFYFIHNEDLVMTSSLLSISKRSCHQKLSSTS